jgi:hypothetical protein
MRSEQTLRNYTFENVAHHLLRERLAQCFVNCVVTEITMQTSAVYFGDSDRVVQQPGASSCCTIAMLLSESHGRGTPDARRRGSGDENCVSGRCDLSSARTDRVTGSLLESSVLISSRS